MERAAAPHLAASQQAAQRQRFSRRGQQHDDADSAPGSPTTSFRNRSRSPTSSAAAGSPGAGEQHHHHDDHVSDIARQDSAVSSGGVSLATSRQHSAFAAVADEKSAARRKRSESRVLLPSSRFWPNFRGLQRRAVNTSTLNHDRFVAEVIILENDEDSERTAIEAGRCSGFDELLLDYQRSAAAIQKRNIWSGDLHNFTDQHLENMYAFLFRTMRIRVQQQFAVTFPQGVADNPNLTPPDVAATALCLLLLDIAITDDDMHSFALTVLPGQRVSLENCPPDRRYAYFCFMALKTVVPQILQAGTAGLDAFRKFVAQYFTLPHMTATPELVATGIGYGVKPCVRAVVVPRLQPFALAAARGVVIPPPPHAFVVCLRPLFNAALPMLGSPHFESRTMAFYHHVLAMERQLGLTGRRSAGGDFRIVEEGAAPAAAAAGSSSHGATPLVDLHNVDADDGDEPTSAGGVGREPSSARSPGVSTTASGMSPGASTTSLPAVLKGRVIGRGASGVVYQAVRVSDGVMLALKNIHIGGTAASASRSPPVTDGAATADAPVMPTASTAEWDGDKADDDEAADRGDGAGGPVTQPAGTARIVGNISANSLTHSAAETAASVAAEIHMLRRLRHPNIVSYYGCTVDTATSTVSILMELAPKSVRGIIEEFGGALPDTLVAVYARQALSGLLYLHDHDIVHRDIKAANLLVTNSGEVKVSDFGTAIVTHTFEAAAGSLSSADIRTSGSFTTSDSAAGLRRQQSSSFGGGAAKGTIEVQGTPQFLAPEVLAGASPMQPTDIWAFGCLLVEMASGNPPWTDEGVEDLFQIAFRLLIEKEGPVIPQSILNPALRDLIASCLAIDPCARPTARDLLRHPFLMASSPAGAQTSATTFLGSSLAANYSLSMTATSLDATLVGATSAHEAPADLGSHGSAGQSPALPQAHRGAGGSS